MTKIKLVSKYFHLIALHFCTSFKSSSSKIRERIIKKKARDEFKINIDVSCSQEIERLINMGEWYIETIVEQANALKKNGYDYFIDDSVVSPEYYDSPHTSQAAVHINEKDFEKRTQKKNKDFSTSLPGSTHDVLREQVSSQITSDGQDWRASIRAKYGLSDNYENKATSTAQSQRNSVEKSFSARRLSRKPRK